MSAVSIGSNISSLSAQRRLSEGSAQLSQTFERLSSGQRINRASDDAAGLSIAETLTASRRVFTQGIRNLGDGISLLNIADGAIEQLTGIVVRLKELAVQSANGSYGIQQRKALDAEAQALSQEYFRIARDTKFNNRSLFDGSLADGIRLQAGFGVDGSILSEIGGAIGDGTFQDRVAYGTGSNPRTVTTGDFNGDGHLDLASSNWGSGSISILMGNGNGTFNAGTAITSPGGDTDGIQAGDFNGDGNLDLITTDATGSTLSVFIGNGNGTFNAGVSYATGTNARSVALADYNGDGILDIASADDGGTTMNIHIGNGDGTFQARVSYTTGTAPTSIDAGDFNGDGIMDIVTADRTTNNLSVFIGNGNGTFQPRVAYGTPTSPFGVEIADLNGDGKLDLISANAGGGENSVSVFLGNGNGTFQTSVSYAAGTSPRNVQAGDFNGDGILDLVAATAAPSLAILIGNGNGTFQPQVNYTSGGGSAYVRTGDFNGDGVLDLVAAENNVNSLGILLGNSRDGIGPLLPFDLKTLSGARQAIPVFDKKIQDLAAQRGIIGAFQSRINVGANLLQVSSENYAAAASRIRDVDIAYESAALVRLNILQKAATAVLGQANLQPALALGLLGAGE